MLTKATTIPELVELVKNYGPRKEFNKGDVVVCVQKPYGHTKPHPGTRYVVVEKVSPAFQAGGMPMSAGQVGDYLASHLEPDPGIEEGFLTRPINSCFFVLESEYVEDPTTSTEET